MFVVKTLLIVVLTLISQSVFSQNYDVKFGKISEEELMMNTYTPDSTATAVVLSDVGRTHFVYNQSDGIRMEFTRHTRIKILKPAGYKWADTGIRLYHDGGNEEELVRLRGYTYNLTDGKIEKEKLKNNQEFREKYDENNNIIKFTMPAVKEGSVIEYEYTLGSDFLFNLQDWEFQKQIPVLWSEYMVTIPEYFNYKQLMQGYYPLIVNEKENSTGNFTVTYRPEANSSNFYSGRPQKKTERITFEQETFHWAAQDIPALVEEPYITTMEDYVMKISFELASTKFPGEMPKVYTRSWENIDDELIDSKFFGKIIERTHSLKDIVSGLTTNSADEQEKLFSIYTYVRDSIHWNGESRLFASKSAKKTLEEKSGNSADLNLSLIALLRGARISAYPVVLSTREHGMLRQAYPMLTQFNYVTALVMLGETPVMLDATEVGAPPNSLPQRCLNGVGRLVSKGFAESWIRINAPTTRSLTVANVTLNEARELDARVTNSVSDYLALKLRKQYSDKENHDRASDLEENHEGWEVSDYHNESWDDHTKPLQEKYNLTCSNNLMAAGDMLYINPMLMQRVAENPFKLEHRAYPVDFTHPSNFTYMINFQIPEGYEVEEVPENLVLSLPEQGGFYSYQIKQAGLMVQLISKLEIGKSRYFAPEYPSLREFYEQLVAKQAEQLVLRKVKKTEE